MKTWLLLVFFNVITILSIAQGTCTTPGQTPSTAFPVCGTSVFQQDIVPFCGNTRIPVPACTDPAQYSDINPFWYKFTCFQTGTLGFTITPINAADDYDWQIFDITGKNPNDAYNADKNMVICANWAAWPGPTGTSATASNLFECSGYNGPNTSKMPTLVQGHSYIMLISNFSQSQKGYKLSFGGGTAVITDPTVPHIRTAKPNCGGDIIRVGLNKKMRCNSIAANGSDFVLQPANATITKATGIGCSSGFDTDSLELTLSTPLPPGTYSLVVKTGTDGNTILDYCETGIADGESLPFTITKLEPTVMDSIAPVGCASNVLKLVFKKALRCSTIANDGSEFSVTGPYPVNVRSAAGTCTGGSDTLTYNIFVTLDKPLYTKGDFIISLKKGNTIVDECNQSVPIATLPFSVKDTVNADFTYQINYGCTTDTVNYFHPGNGEVNSWQWTLGEGQTDNQQNPTAYYKTFNASKNVRLIVSNGVCSDTSMQVVTLENYLKAGFTVNPDQCPLEPVAFTNTTIGKIASYDWAFGDGGTDMQRDASYTYQRNRYDKNYTISLTVVDSFGCSQTVNKNIMIYRSCVLDVPNAFTPDKSTNNTFYPLNAVKADDLQFTIYNRWGQQLYYTINWKKGWDGTYGGQLQAPGTYAWTLSYIDRDSKKHIFRKGTVTLVR